MIEIDRSGRENFYIISSLSERCKDAHITTLMDEEILNAKLLFGRDKKCCDVIPFRSEKKRSLAIAACVRNAFIRDGCDIKEQIPIAKYFMDNLCKLANFLQKEVLSYKDMVEKSIDIKKHLEENTIEMNIEQIEKDYNEENMIISRPDTPREINIYSSTNERVGSLVLFHVIWYEWLSSCQPSDLVRCRIWHLYMLVRIQQAAFLDNNLPFFDKAVTLGRLFFPRDHKEEYHDEYWLRVLSMPLSEERNDDAYQSSLLSAYSSYMSAVSRTYIMSSLKRINVVKHSYALMYGVSLLDMTVKVNDLVDSHLVFPKPPIGYKREFSVEEYFDTIFRCLVDEYFVHGINDVISKAISIEKVEGSPKILALAKEGMTKPTVLAIRMLTSITEGNMRSEEIKRKSEENIYRKSKSQKKSLIDLYASKTAAIACDIDADGGIIGAVTLTRKHEEKNAVSYLVDKIIIDQSGDTTNSIKTTKIDTRYILDGIDVSYVGSGTYIKPDDKEKILKAIRSSMSSKKHFINSVTDRRLLKESQNVKKFSKILSDLRNKVTHVKSINLYQGQNVVFTDTNFKEIHGTEAKFVTKDTGVITDIIVENGITKVFVLVERLGRDAIELTEGRHFLGKKNNNYVQYIPLDSSQAMTIYSSQGQTFNMDTIVDLTGVSASDAYVAITRNSDPLHLYIIQSTKAEKKNLADLKYSMRKDKTILLPLGGIGKFGGDAFMNYDAINVAKEVLDTVIAYDVDNGQKSQYSSFDPASDMVTAAQHFILNRSGNTLAFNSTWMKNTRKILMKDGLKTELNRINEFFFGPGKHKYAKYYMDTTNDKIMELFTAVTRSVTHYAIATHIIKTPSPTQMKDHIESHKNKNEYVKIHPCFLNAPPMEKSLSAFFYDVAPHSKIIMVFQFYIHYLFLVYEQLHICNASFAFLSSTSPKLNKYTRPKNYNESCCCVPSGGLGYESEDFKEAIDGGSRDKLLRVPLTDVDELGDNIEGLKEDPAMCNEYISKSMRHNLRRPGKFCRPHETCGLSKHGAIVVATKSEKIEHSHVHENEQGWISLSNEVNMYGLLIFMTKLAAASGITVIKLNEEALEPKKGRQGSVFVPLEECGIPPEYQLRLSEEVLRCGQVAPMKRVQFTLHAVAREVADEGRLNNFSSGKKIFSSLFLKSERLMGAEILMITEMMGHCFAQHSTSDIRNSLFLGVGNVLAKQTIDNNDNNVIAQIEDFIKTKLTTAESGIRVSFFVSLKL